MTAVPAQRTLPVVQDSPPLQRLVFTMAIVVAYALLAALATRLAPYVLHAGWLVPLAIFGGLVAADFLSGLVHWAADTWGRDDLPVVGPLLLVPFRVHHANPDDFRRRRFVDVNGDVALVAIPILSGLLQLPPDSATGAALFGGVFCAASMLTNQIHQWAHMTAPRPVRVLQACGLALAPSAHAAHHDHPYDVRYCITTGWCNRPLEAIRFFRALEHSVCFLTRARPRRDDRRYHGRYGPATTRGR